MQLEEKSAREEIYDGDTALGRVTVKYPSFPEKYKKVNKFYIKFADAYLSYAKKRIPKLYNSEPGLQCSAVMFYRVCACGDTDAELQFEMRLYRGNDCIYQRRFSMIWDLRHSLLKGKKKEPKREKKR